MFRRHLAPVPDAADTGWVKLGEVMDDVGCLALVSPHDMADLYRQWLAHLDGIIANRLAGNADSADALTTFREWEVRSRPDLYHGATAITVDTEAPMVATVEGRFTDYYRSGHPSIVEVRIRFWPHDHYDDCDGCSGCG